MTAKQFWLGLVLVCGAASATFVATDADARRLGGGGSAGMRRSLPPRQPSAPPAQTPQQQQQQAPANAAAQPAPSRNAAAPAAAAAPQMAPRRPWLAPLAGLAAGLGLAALASHFGFGDGLANVMTLLLLGVLAFVAIRFVLGRLRAGQQGARLRYAGADAPASGPHWAETRPVPAPIEAAASGAPGLPAGFDAVGFEKIAKLIFIRLQAANDAGDLNDLRAFTTPEMFAAARLDLQNRVPGEHQQTDVVQLAAEIVDYTRESERDIVSVRYSGLLREAAGGTAEPFDEVWHLARGAGGEDWRIAGIQQSAAFA